MTVPERKVPITQSGAIVYLNAPSPVDCSSGSITVDGQVYTTPAVFNNWSPGSTHTFSAAEYTNGDKHCAPAPWLVDESGTQVYSANPVNVTVGDSWVALTPIYTIQYQLTIYASGGIVSPQSGWYNAGSKLTISATPATSGYMFHDWSGCCSGSYSGPQNPAHIVMNGPITEIGYFIPIPVPILRMSKTHTGNFTQGQQGATYTIVVSNVDGSLTNGTVTVSENIPAGLTLVSMSGNGWTCPAGGNTCTRSDPLNVNGWYNPIVVTVNVAANAPAAVINQASVYGGGGNGAAASDPTTISKYVTCVRDFRGMQHSDALIYDAHTGSAYSALSNGDGTYQYVYNLFTSGFDTLRTGDYNGDDKADLVLYNSKSGLAYVGMSNGDGTFGFQSLFWSPGYDFVEAGDLDGDGRTDFVLYNSSTGTMYSGISNGSGAFSYKYSLISRGYTLMRVADFSGDGKADLFLYNAANGQAFFGLGDGAGGFTFHFLFVSPGYDIADVGDLNGDGQADLILYNSANGNTATGISDGSGGFAFTPLLFSPGFTSVHLADYTGDGKADVTVYNKNSGAAYVGTGTGSGNFTFQSLFWSPGYDIQVGDLNGDGKLDVILYNGATGTEYSGMSNGNGTFSYTYSLWGPAKTLAK